MKHDVCSGMSLLELLVVLSLLSAFGLFASRCFAEAVGRELVRRTGRELAGFLEHKALEAMTRGRAIYLVLDDDGGIGESTDPPGDGVPSRIIYRLPPRLSFQGSHLPRLKSFEPHIRFGEEGGATAASIRVSSLESDEECLITQALSGRRVLRCLGER